MGAHRLDPTREVLPPHAVPRHAEPGDRPDRVRDARRQVPVADESRCGEHTHQRLVGPSDRLCDVLEVQNVSGAVPVLHDRLHSRPSAAQSLLQRQRSFEQRFNNGCLAHWAKPLSAASCWATMASRITS